MDPPYLVELHVSAHLAPEPPSPLIGEWVKSRIEYVELPTGWHPLSCVMAAIRQHPEADLLLAVVRREIRRRTLLRRGGGYRDAGARRIGEAVLSLRALL